MSDFFTHCRFPEPSAALAYAGSRLDRRGENRSPEALEQALDSPNARLLIFIGDRLLVRIGSTLAEPLFRVGDSAPFRPDLARAVLLGHAEGRPLLAAASGLDIERDKSLLPDDIKAIDIRSLALQGLLPPDLMGDAAQGAALLAWHAAHQFCSACGAVSEPQDGGYKRICPACGAQHFPRTDPAVIMLALHGDHCLMGRSPGWREGVYSALAGFVDPGETIEDAVRRELAEEAGIKIGRVMYHACQPWPFPHSLMIGCFAEALSRDIVLVDDELEDCRWFSRHDVRGALAAPEGAEFATPSHISIAYHLLAHWAGQGSGA